VVAGALLAGCASRPGTDLAGDVSYAPGRELDVHFPVDPGPWPVFVLIHGAGLERGSYSAFADLLAQSGAVVFNADWPVLADHVEDSLGDIACAVRYARENASEFGGDPDRTVLIGHSTGAVYAGEVATNGDVYASDCSAEASALTEGLALLSPAQVPGGGPWSHRSLGSNPDLRIVVVHGHEDTVARPSLSVRTTDLLEEAGYEVSLTLLDSDHFELVLVSLAGRDHDELPDDHPALITAAVIMDLARSLD
jgi:alpha-beta hydrolase superfamily lysophospholipase